MTAADADKAAEWRGMSGAVAFGIIGNALTWPEIDAMMDAWRRANPITPQPSPDCCDGHDCARN